MAQQKANESQDCIAKMKGAFIPGDTGAQKSQHYRK
jgi:hypothetical protein